MCAQCAVPSGQYSFQGTTFMECVKLLSIYDNKICLYVWNEVVDFVCRSDFGLVCRYDFGLV